MKSKHQEAYDILRRRILDGTMTPGFRLVTDVLARELNMSASPIREAIRRLEAEGLVEHIHNVGALVSAMDEHRYRGVLETLAVLEGYATAQAASRMHADDIRALWPRLEAMHAAVERGDLMAYARLNREFHEAIYAFCGNQVLVDTIRRLWDAMNTLRHNLFVLMPERARSSLIEHYRLVEALRTEQEPRTIEDLAREHKLSMWAAYEAHKTGILTESRAE